MRKVIEGKLPLRQGPVHVHRRGVGNRPRLHAHPGRIKSLERGHLIGVQELGQGFRTFKQDEKMDLMHVAVCTVLVPQGFYAFMGRDEEGSPHLEEQVPLPELAPKEQDTLIRRGILDYFGEDPGAVIGPRSA